MASFTAPSRASKTCQFSPGQQAASAEWWRCLPSSSPDCKTWEGFSHVILLYHFHLVTQTRLVVVPFLDRLPHGIFATRAPSRPNTIGLSVVRLVSVTGQVLHIENVDIVDGTPLLDIKPYVPQFDHYEVDRTGWMVAAGDNLAGKRSDDRFG